MIFIDSSFLIALLLKKDTNHEKALLLNKELDSTHETKVINSTVLFETLNKLSKKQKLSSQLYNEFSKRLSIMYLEEENYRNAFKINQQLNNALNYNDCTILETMIRVGINKIFSFDSDFDKVNGVIRISL